MIRSEEIRLAKIADASRIATMSRDFIESGLGWSWTVSHVVRKIRSRRRNVIVSAEGTEIVGFAVMQYADNKAHLELLGVHPKHRRTGIGKRLIQWLETTALVSGIGVVYLETRLRNEGAREFYKGLGYQVVQRIPRYYKGRETAIRMAHDLWSDKTGP